MSESRRAEAVEHWPGPALYGIVLSQRSRPAAWKLPAIRKAQEHYLAYWRQHKNMAMPVWHSGAYTEAYLLTKEPSYAAAVFEMNDWLCALQYQQVDPARAAWVGGFPTWIDGKATAHRARHRLGRRGAQLGVRLSLGTFSRRRAALSALSAGAGKRLAIFDDVAIRGGQHPAFCRVVSSRAGRGLPCFRPGWQSARWITTSTPSRRWFNTSSTWRTCRENRILPLYFDFLPARRRAGLSVRIS